MNNKIIFGIGGIIAGLLLAFILTPGGFFGYRTAGFRMMGFDTEGVGNTQVMNGIDRHFIEQMIPHHEGAIAMATLALQKAVHPEIKTLAQAILVAQTKENVDMRVWYGEWFGTDAPENTLSMMGGMMSQRGMHMGGQEDINKLNTAADFDKEFIEQMIPHHQMAIMMAQMLKAGTSRLEMLTLANNITESQSKEIEQMESWYKSWYK
ncbi:MAG: DUF305 domain-containing protein [Candidatus Campbellbacteria bacterium]|nr:DUF305 domain-containing protein [Candidatus Campbellbacteria bacterium]